MSTEDGTKATAREVWLLVALAVARDGLAEPKVLRVSDVAVHINVDGHSAARAWGAWIDALETERWRDYPKLSTPLRSVSYYNVDGRAAGWYWAVEGDEPLATPVQSMLAAEVVAAIDAAPAGNNGWTCPKHCGYGIADGPAPDGEPSTDELIREHLEQHTPVAV